MKMGSTPTSDTLFCVYLLLGKKTGERALAIFRRKSARCGSAASHTVVKIQNPRELPKGEMG